MLTPHPPSREELAGDDEELGFGRRYGDFISVQYTESQNVYYRVVGPGYSITCGSKID
jgi:hypothetical protein